MAGLLAWAADVVGGNGGGRTDEENYPDSIPLIFTPEQQTYVQELDRKAASLNRSIQDLRQRLPPPDISQRLPHLHAHSLASNAALALQLNAHSTTKQQVLPSPSWFYYKKNSLIPLGIGVFNKISFLYICENFGVDGSYFLQFPNTT